MRPAPVRPEPGGSAWVSEGEEDRAELFDGLGRASGGCGAVCLAGGSDRLEQFLLFGENDLLLVAEVAEERGPADFGALGDVADRDAVEAALKEQLLAGNPVAHHVTNVVITSEEDDLVTARSKGLMIMADRAFASVTHLDTLRRHNGGWRISRRVVLAQRTPMGGAHLAHAGDR